MSRDHNEIDAWLALADDALANASITVTTNQDVHVNDEIAAKVGLDVIA